MRIVSAALAGALGAALMADFVIWGGYNLLYPQILLPRTLRGEERILALLTEPEEEVFVTNNPVSSLDVMDLELIPSDACGALSYPYFYEMWGDRAMASLRKRPRVLQYNAEETIWGYVFREYAPDFDAYVREHYTRLPQAEELWVRNEDAPEALRLLEAEGYGNLVVSNMAGQPQNTPVKMFPGGSVRVRFTAVAENLTAIRFCAVCYHRRSSPELTLRVTDPESGEILAEGAMTGAEIGDNFFSRCPMGGRLTPGREYELEILVNRIGGKGDMEFCFVPGGELAMAAEYACGEDEAAEPRA